MYGLRSDRRLHAHVTAWMLADARDFVVYVGGDRAVPPVGGAADRRLAIRV